MAKTKRLAFSLNEVFSANKRIKKVLKRKWKTNKQKMWFQLKWNMCNVKGNIQYTSNGFNLTRTKYTLYYWLGYSNPNFIYGTHFWFILNLERSALANNRYQFIVGDVCQFVLKRHLFRSAVKRARFFVNLVRFAFSCTFCWWLWEKMRLNNEL